MPKIFSVMRRNLITDAKMLLESMYDLFEVEVTQFSSDTVNYSGRDGNDEYREGSIQWVNGEPYVY